MLEIIRKYAKSEGLDLGLREKLIRRIMFIATILILIAFIEVFVATSTYLTAIPLGFLLITLELCLVFTYKYRKVEMSAVIVGIVAIGLVFPSIFFLSGGIQGGASIWFVLGIFYAIGMFDGKRMLVFLSYSIIVDVCTYIIAYRKQDLIINLASREEVYSDSLFGIILVGVMMGAVTKYQLNAYNKEKEIAIEQKLELETVSKSKNMFLANMSHEIRTPISTIMGLNEMILRNDQIDEAVSENSIGIQNSSRMLLSLVNDILDMSLIDSNQMLIQKIRYNSIEMLKELIEIISPRAKEKNLELFIRIDEHMPKELLGDERRLKQVVLNVLLNAVKYTREGAIIFSVKSEKADNDECRLIIEVEDTGIGIKLEDVSEIFEGFSNASKSSGLGLAVSKQIMRLMNGDITVESIYTKGSVFRIILNQGIFDATPVGNIDFNRMKIGIPQKYRQAFEAPEAKVLIVDDNEVNRHMISQLLEPTKVQIELAKSGVDCLDKTSKNYYNIILMDYMMPDMDGVDTMKNVRHQENGLCRNTPIIVLTADGTSNASRRFKELGFDGFLEKPFKSSSLEEMILGLLPLELIEYKSSGTDLAEASNDNNTIGSLYRRKKIYITADCVCDIPDSLLKKYDIRLMYLYINTGASRFCDTKEINSDNLNKLFFEGENGVVAEAASVKDYENFFGQCLLEAEEVIHISLGMNMGISYSNALKASEGFGHVKVVDSGHLSGGMALVVLDAARMALRGGTVDEICDEVARMKKNIVSNFLMPSAKTFYKNGYTDIFTTRICSIFRFHPIIFIRQSGLKIYGVRAGNIDMARKRFVRQAISLRRKAICDIVFITHAGLTVEQQEALYEEVRKTGRFKRIEMQNSSVTNACFSGMGTIGIAFAVER